MLKNKVAQMSTNYLKHEESNAWNIDIKWEWQDKVFLQDKGVSLHQNAGPPLFDGLAKKKGRSSLLINNKKVSYNIL